MSLVGGGFVGLEQLYDRLQRGLRACREYAMNPEQQARVDWLEEWLNNEGRLIIEQLRSDEPQKTHAIRAAAKLSPQKIENAEDWEEMFDWVKEILPSLQRAFKTG